LFRYPRLSPLPAAAVSNHDAVIVGATRLRIPNAVACQVFYPASASVSHNNKDPYFRPEAAQGLAEYLGMNPNLCEMLSCKDHPCHTNAEPASAGNFPLVLFSHGLGGCMEMYSELCINLAAQGCVVLALEHEDGSGCYAETQEGTVVSYKRPDNTPYSREKVLKFRTPMLEQRMDEVERVMNYIQEATSPNNNKETQSAELLHKILQSTNSKQICLVGHSFGAATMVLVAQQQVPNLNSVSLLDTWAFPLSDAVLNQGIPNLPVLSIFSESWTKNRETSKVIQLLESTKDSNILWAPNTVHQSFADTGCWLPSPLAKRMHMRGKQEPKHEFSASVAHACVNHIRSALSSGNSSVDAATSDATTEFPKFIKELHYAH